MGLATSYTLSVSLPTPTDWAFGQQQLNGNTVSYVAPSPQGDLVGRPTMLFQTEQTKGGIVRSLVKINVPYYNSGSSSYTGSYTANLTLARPASLPELGSKQVLEMIAELITNNSFAVRDIVASGRH